MAKNGWLGFLGGDSESRKERVMTKDTKHLIREILVKELNICRVRLGAAQTLDEVNHYADKAEQIEKALDEVRL